VFSPLHFPLKFPADKPAGCDLAASAPSDNTTDIFVFTNEEFSVSALEMLLAGVYCEEQKVASERQDGGDLPVLPNQRGPSQPTPWRLPSQMHAMVHLPVPGGCF
jgi:hypothetical protein